MAANDRQVGGDHYKSKIQHWDWVYANNLDYFQGQITKYVARWKAKNGLDDLYKAKHFLDKYIELEEAALKPESRIKELDIMLNVPVTLAYEGGNMSDDFWQCKLCRKHLHSNRGTLPEHNCVVREGNERV